MKKNMSLQRAMRLGLIKQCDVVNVDRIFPEKKGKTMLTTDQTGFWTQQYFTREKLKWYYMEIDDKPYIVSGPTQRKLCLCGEKGVANRKDAMGQIAWLYCNPNELIIAEPLSIKMYDKMRNHSMYYCILNNYLSQITGPVWLSDYYKRNARGLFYLQNTFKEFFVISEGVSGARIGKDCYNCFFIDLSDKNIFVDMAYHRKHGIWKFIL